jgi:hypothetical protein
MIRKHFALFLYLLVLAGGWQSCQPADDSGFRGLVAEIEGKDRKLAQLRDTTGTGPIVADLTRQCLALADRFPKDTLVPDLLFREAKNLMGKEAHDYALSLWEKIWTQYPAHRYAPVALFMQAFTLDSVHRDVEQAALHYGELIARYPETEVARQARRLLEVVDLSPEELVRHFQGE